MAETKLLAAVKGVELVKAVVLDEHNVLKVTFTPVNPHSKIEDMQTQIAVLVSASNVRIRSIEYVTFK